MAARQALTITTSLIVWSAPFSGLPNQRGGAPGEHSVTKIFLLEPAGSVYGDSNRIETVSTRWEFSIPDKLGGDGPKTIVGH